MPYWAVPSLWRGETVAVLASGQSLTPQMADKVKHLPRITVNTTWKMAPDADICYAADALWWGEYGRSMDVKRKVSIEIRDGCYPSVDGDVWVLRNTGPDGFDPDPRCLRAHGNSGAQAIQVAVHAGAARILLLGFDMHGSHWHGDHPSPLGNNGDRLFERWIASMASLAHALDARGVEVLNCTPGSALKCFAPAMLEEALCA